MTMHLISGVRSTPKKSKSTLTKSKQEQIKKDWQFRCKELKSQGRHKELMTLDDYTNYVMGKTKKTKTATKVSLDHLTKKHSTDHKSIADGKGDTSRKEPTKYTGTLIKGLSQMHKSNLVPVINEEEIHAIARMRR